ncbi:MAG: aquaporin [Actinomycetales bacterium]|nr:aquaporin [Actinomycetales bacterium]
MVGSEVVRRSLAEAIGTGVLVATVVGSGIMATTLTRDVGLQLVINALATVASLAVLIWSLGPISGAHFNPAVTLTAAVRRELPVVEAGAYVAAQVFGGLAGVPWCWAVGIHRMTSGDPNLAAVVSRWSLGGGWGGPAWGISSPRRHVRQRLVARDDLSALIWPVVGARGPFIRVTSLTSCARALGRRGAPG